MKLLMKIINKYQEMVKELINLIDIKNSKIALKIIDKYKEEIDKLFKEE